MKNRLLNMRRLLAALILTTTSASAQYCIPTYSYGCGVGDNINTFTLSGSGINHQNSGCSTGGYGDFTADPVLIGNVEATSVYNFNITHGYSSQYVKIYIDFNNDQTFDEVTELLFSSVGTAALVTTGSITIPAMAPVNGLRMRVIDVYYNAPTSCGSYTYGETHDYTVNILAAPTCIIASNISISAVTAFTADINWNSVANGIGYNIEWGTPGFVPGTGTESGNASGIVGSPYQMTSLTPATDYDVYIQTDCDVIAGLSQWAGPNSFTTPCVPISTLPWDENFDALTSIGDDIFPNCWVGDGNNSGSGDEFTNYADADALSLENFIYFQYGSDSYVFTPEFGLTAGETYEFTFSWAGDGYDSWNGEIVVSETQSSVGATAIGVPFVSYGDLTTLDYKSEKYCFTPTADGNYSFGFHVTESDYNYYLNIDDVGLRQSSASVGTDSTVTVCEQSGLVNLDDLAQITDFFGKWTYPNNLAALVNGNEFNIDVIPNSTVSVVYEANSCLAPDVTVTITVIPSISAGINGTVNVCKNQLVDLLSGLSGTLTLGGQWYNSSNTMIPSSYINSGNLSGQFNFSYIVENGGICDNDTAQVILNVNPCNYLSVDELDATTLSVYPNPTSGNISVMGNFGSKQVSYSVVNLNGEVIANASAIQINGKEMVIDLSSAVKGMYILKVMSNDSETIFRIVKQ